VHTTFSFRLRPFVVQITMSTVAVPQKHSHDDVEVGIEAPAAKSLEVDPKLHPVHPHNVLQYLVKTVLPEKCRSEYSKVFYQVQLDDPEAAMEECKGMLAGWIAEYWETSQLNSIEEYD
jgi:hypothetical protein